MRAGLLNRKIVIQSKTITTDSYGGQVESWATFATVWASKNPLNGRELMAAQAAQSEVTTKFVTRYLSGVLPSMRISFGGEYYNISEVIDPDDAHRELQILTTSGVNDG